MNRLEMEKRYSQDEIPDYDKYNIEFQTISTKINKTRPLIKFDYFPERKGIEVTLTYKDNSIYKALININEDSEWVGWELPSNTIIAHLQQKIVKIS